LRKEKKTRKKKKNEFVKERKREECKGEWQGRMVIYIDSDL
jgi:hypothetical protein